ncbi:MAG: hypothetical protein ACREJB_18005 [Planctomycetaceae bacterium]
MKRASQFAAVVVLVASLAGCCGTPCCVDPCAPCGGCCPPAPCVRFDPCVVAHSIAGAVCSLRGGLCSLFCSPCGGGYGYGGGYGNCCCPNPCCEGHGVPGYGPPVYDGVVPPYGPGPPGTPVGGCPYCQPATLPAGIPVQTAPIPQVPPAKDISANPSPGTRYLPTSAPPPAVAPGVPAAYQHHNARNAPWSPERL